MKPIGIFCLISVIGCIVAGAIKPVSAQSPLTLPTDFIFTTFPATFDTPIYPSYSFIDRVDAQTQQVSLFYANSFGSVAGLSWSPSGKSLAVGIAGHIDQTGQIVSADKPNDYEAHICVLDRTGQFQRCMKQPVPIGLAGSEGGAGFDNNYNTVTWSDDEQKLYFVAFDTTGVGELVEADVQTGDTLRIAYNKPDLDVFTAIWSPNADYLVLRSKTINFGDRASLIHLSSTGQELSRIELAQPLAAPPSVQNNSAVTPVGTHIRAPCSFSPHGTYLAIIDGDVYDPPYEFSILDISGTVRYRLVNSGSNVLPYNCPDWKPDESGMYFENHNVQAGDTIYRYTLITGSVDSYDDQMHGLPHIYSPFNVSPDGNYLAFETDTNPGYAAAGHEGSVLPRIAVIGPNNSLAFFSGVDSIGKRPLWVPPLKP